MPSLPHTQGLTFSSHPPHKEPFFVPYKELSPVSLTCCVHIFCLCLSQKIDFRERKRKGRTSVCSSTHLCLHWLIRVCALTGNGSRNLGILGRPLTEPPGQVSALTSYFFMCFPAGRAPVRMLVVSVYKAPSPKGTLFSPSQLADPILPPKRNWKKNLKPIPPSEDELFTQAIYEGLRMVPTLIRELLGPSLQHVQALEPRTSSIPQSPGACIVFT